MLAKKIIPTETPYVDIRCGQALKRSLAYQGGIVAWVAFRAFYGQGAGNLSRIVSFGAAHMTVLIVEPLIDLAMLAAAKPLDGLRNTMVVEKRLYTSMQG